MSLALLILGLLSLAEAQVQLPAPPSPANGMVRILSANLGDGTQEIWDVDRTRYEALPVWDPATATIPLTLNDALTAAETWLTRQHPDLKAWYATNAALVRVGGGGAFFYRLSFVPEGTPASVLFPAGSNGRFSAVILLDGSVVEPKRIEGAPAQPVQEPSGAYRVGAGVAAPRLLENPKPHYTAAALGAKIQGTVRLSCVVNTDGRCADITIVQSLDTRLGLDDEAITALRKWRFAPGTLGGKPVRVRVIVELSFNLEK